MLRLALVTCAALPDLDPDDRLVQEALVRRGARAEAVVWDDPGVDWSAYDLAVVRSTWDYTSRRDEFLDWARTVPRLANPADVLAWNTDKRYLRDLAAAGVPTVPTTWVEPGEDADVPRSGDYVVKPTVGAGARDAARYTAGVHDGLARTHLDQLAATGRSAMMQPYVSSVDTRGETALVFLGGEFSHAIVKSALLDGPDPHVPALYREERTAPRAATTAERALAERVLEAVPGGPGQLAYARVDVVAASAEAGDTVVLLELEVSEPSLFLGRATGAADRFADALLSRALAPSG